MNKNPEAGNLLEQEEPLNPHSRDFYNSRTRKTQLENSVVYYFDYSNASSKDDEETITWRELKELKDKRNWAVLRHPMVLNFVNEKLLERAIFYAIHIISYLLFLLLLSSYIFGKTPSQDVLATIFLIVFGFCLLVKGAVKLQHGKVSKWFIASYLFNIITYLCTFLFLWTPQLFAYDDYNNDLKHFITWFLPIIAIVSAWINFLYILRKSPSGIYILMMSRILYSFSQIAIIWIPTLLAFAFAFHLVMRNSGTEPWEATEAFTSSNSTFARKLLAIFQAVTKTSTMMIGEVDADSVLERKEWIPNLLLIAFEVITVILLMNLMISLAVGDVHELRNSAQEKLLEIKVNFVIETLQLSEACDCFGDSRLSFLHKKPTNNVLVVECDGDSYTSMKKLDFCDQLEELPPPVPDKPPQAVFREIVRDVRLAQAQPGFHVLRECVHPETNVGMHSPSSTYDSGVLFAEMHPEVKENVASKVYYIHFPTDPHGVRLQKKSVAGRTVQMAMDAAIIQLIEGSDSGIKKFSGSIDDRKDHPGVEDEESYKKKFARWLIGLDWSSLVDS